MKSLLSKFLVCSLLIILLPMGLALLWTSSAMTDLLERRFVEMSRARAEQVKVFLTQKQETATGLVHWVAEMPGVRDALIARDRRALFQHLLPLVGSIEMDFIEILDDNGEIFLRVHDPSRYGDRPRLAKDIQGLLEGVRDLSNYGAEQRDGNAYLRAAESIQGQRIYGVVSAGYALNHDFVKRLEQVAGGRVVVSIADRAYSAVGNELESEQTLRKLSTHRRAGDFHWHRENPEPFLEIRTPLDTDRGAEGTLSLFFSSEELTSAIGTLQRNLYSVALVGIVLAFCVSWLLSRRLTKPLEELVHGTEQVAAGNLSVVINADSHDEIGMLASSFNRMLDELRRSKSEVENYRRQLEQKFQERGRELAETEQKRAAMVHMIAHDLKNPLIGIKKTLESLQHTGIDKEQKKKILQDLLGAGDLVIGMVNEMLDLYRSDFGDLPLSLGRFQIEESIQTSLRILGPELEEKRLQVSNHSDPPHIPITADKRRVTRLLINLLSNAVKFSPDRRRIHIVTRLMNGAGKPRLLMRVEDEGIGIPEKDLTRIFDRFYSRDLGSIERGTGLGLHYCKLVTEAHRGKIWAETRSGGGFAVSVLLPTNVESERAEPYDP